jgi:hypothetical protein
MGEKYTYKDLGTGNKGAIVTFTLSGSAANCVLVDSSNYNNFRNGRPFRYHGGAVTQSPYRLPVPDNGHWYAVVFLGAYRGPVRSSITVSRPPTNLAPAPAMRPIPAGPSPLADLVRDEPPAAGTDVPTYDVFISHASEDKEAVARPLRNYLEDAGLDVWLDEAQMRIGSSLRRSIDQGIARSRFAVVVLSPDYIRKGWTQYELDGVVTRQVGGEQVLLPVWHGITRAEVAAFSPTLADRLARDTSDIAIDDIAQEIISVVRPEATD